tara:strand:+ start:97 stop:375 length:279 start_codon:yes stop_codon:yes gene_type:complete
MPTYVFKEKGKRKLKEIQMRISELEHFKLKNPQLVQVPTAPSFRLKGTGWYETDFKTGEKKNLVKEESEKKISTKTQKKSNGKKTKEKAASS